MKSPARCLLQVAVIILTTVVSCSMQDSTEDETRHPPTERDVSLSVEPSHEVMINCNADVNVSPSTDGFEVTFSLRNSSGDDLAFLPSFLVMNVKPKMPVWYPPSISPCIMELIIDSIPSEPFMQHATSMISLTQHPIQFIPLAQHTTTTVVYHIPYDDGLTKEKVSGLRVYRGSFNVPVWLVNDRLRSELISRYMIPKSSSNHYALSVRDGAMVITSMVIKKTNLSPGDAELLLLYTPQAPCIRAKFVTIDSILR